ILFVPKPEGRGLRLCVNYRGLNKITIRNRYPLPLMNELRDRVTDAKRFTKLDLMIVYNSIRMKEGDEYKTAFRTRYGHFEWNVMSLGLCNAPATFQEYMNDLLREYLDQGVIVYLDDILIYSDNEDEHTALVSKVLKTLEEQGLTADIAKCVFDDESVLFLGFVLSSQGVSLANGTIKAVLDWAPPKSVKEVQVFLGFANFYRRFVRNFSGIAKPLSEATKGNPRDFVWSVACQTAFDFLKACFTSAPTLRHFDPTLPIHIEADASDFAVGGTLSQYFGKNLHPIAFLSRKLSP